MKKGNQENNDSEAKKSLVSIVKDEWKFSDSLLHF